MTKKTLLILVCLLVTVFTLSACSGVYDFKALENNPEAGAPVTNNGGTVVNKGDYTYFINGAESNTANNIFNKVVKGGIARIKTADMSMLTGTETAPKIEIVVPKIVYASDAESSGIYIFGDRIYYTTPSDERDKNGTLLNTQLDFMSVKLDGTGTQKLLTHKSNGANFLYVYEEGAVTILFAEDNSLYSFNTASKVKTGLLGKDKEGNDGVEKVVVSYKIDRSANCFYYTEKVTEKDSHDNDIEQNYNLLKKVDYKGVITEIKNGKATDNTLGDTKYTITKAENGAVYYTVANTKTTDKSLYRTKDSVEKKITNNAISTFLVKSDNEIVYINNRSFITILTLSDNSNETYHEICLASGATLLKLDNTAGIVYYTMNSLLYKSNYTDSRVEGKVLTTSKNETAWAPFEIVGDTIYFFNSSETLTNYMYFAKFVDGKIVEKRLAILTEDDLETEENN